MPRAKKLVSREDYKESLRKLYKKVGAEYGSRRPAGAEDHEWDLIELGWARMSDAPSQADVEREKQEKVEAERLRREEIRKDGIRRRGAKSAGTIDAEAERYRKETFFEGGVDEYYWEKLRSRIHDGVGENKLETIHTALTTITDDAQKQYEVLKRLKITIGKLKTNVLNDYREGDLDVLYESVGYHKNVKPVLDDLFKLSE